MGSVYRRPGRSIWMMQYYRNGIRIRASSETTSKMKAQRRCHDLETARSPRELLELLGELAAAQMRKSIRRRTPHAARSRR